MFLQRITKQGFTLVEVVVVVSVITILASIAGMAYSEARKQARDDIRISQLEALRLAIELYNEENGVYPAMGCGGPYDGTSPSWAQKGAASSDAGSWMSSCNGDYILGLVPNFIANLPLDTNQEDDVDKGFLYMTNVARTSYKLMIYDAVETKLVTNYNHPYARCPRSFTSAWCGATAQANTYAVYSAGAESW